MVFVSKEKNEKILKSYELFFYYLLFIQYNSTAYPNDAAKIPATNNPGTPLYLLNTCIT